MERDRQRQMRREACRNEVKGTVGRVCILYLEGARRWRHTMPCSCPTVGELVPPGEAAGSWVRRRQEAQADDA
ncbi:hypothetical protein HBI56_181910 [Parastagonospora nodorum]|uniref:Uncharacterized protein n=1 Tax=Phaeosphaeria nodorum (strain SN15 / ATCC MYA-4574 / FGSC 10173) TaxID=321614 RepID=A0A7U2F907_PHANO|nr:hypothetical protein HBH56_187320 [Parastagonospora nodorum]QRD00975.1 hypothetical protein JI435_416080 [Parastagonospora nodorum SN15]KAH3925289.1 hypothetical protein HBH54_181240 [Parastagonospora nodorum]KAH3953031.1 hypothetical protein HBH53_034750 [Parastagonospora nodorum]KAH3959166.1 hypothetical protein HBH52_245840 [Parastagonospora nodorum]